MSIIRILIWCFLAYLLFLVFGWIWYYIIYPSFRKNTETEDEKGHKDKRHQKGCLNNVDNRMHQIEVLAKREEERLTEEDEKWRMVREKQRAHLKSLRESLEELVTPYGEHFEFRERNGRLELWFGQDVLNQLESAYIIDDISSYRDKAYQIRRYRGSHVDDCREFNNDKEITDYLVEQIAKALACWRSGKTWYHKPFSRHFSI